MFSRIEATAARGVSPRGLTEITVLSTRFSVLLEPKLQLTYTYVASKILVSFYFFSPKIQHQKENCQWGFEHASSPCRPPPPRIGRWVGGTEIGTWPFCARFLFYAKSFSHLLTYFDRGGYKMLHQRRTAGTGIKKLNALADRSILHRHNWWNLVILFEKRSQTFG